MINKLLNKLPYKIKTDKEYYYLNITKCFGNTYRVMYWNFDKDIKIKQFGKGLLDALQKTKIALDMLKEIGEIR